MYSGIHGPNTPTFLPVDYDCIRWGRFSSLKLMVGAGQNPALASMLRLTFPAAQLVLRTTDLPLPFSNFVNGMVNRWFAEIGSFYYAGVRLFQCDNEPQMTWDTAQKSVTGPYNYTYWYRRIMPALRLRLNSAGMQDAVLITAPLTFSPGKYDITKDNPYWTLNQWKAAFLHTDSPQELPAIRCGQANGANCYWQDPPSPEPPRRNKQRFDPSYGRSFEWYHDQAGLPVHILEYGNSLNLHQNPTYSPAQVEAARVQQYPEYLQWLRQFEYVRSAHAFISPGATRKDWGGFYVTTPVAQAIGKVG